MSDDRPSIAELQRIANRQPQGDARSNDQISLRNAAPVLLEIAAAALAWRGRTGEMRTDSQMRDVCAALINALAKVRP